MPDYTLLTPITQQVGDAAGASVDAFFTVGRDYIAPGMEKLVEGLHLARSRDSPCMDDRRQLGGH